MNLKEMTESMKASIKSEEEMQRVMDIAKAINPDNELSLDDLDSVSGGAISYYDDGEICHFDKVMLTIILGGYIATHTDEGLTFESAKAGFEQYIRENNGEVTPKVEQFVEETLREYFAHIAKN